MSDLWTITREGCEPEATADNGNRFLIGNGYIGVRGALEEDGKDKQAAWNLAGVYDKAEGQTWREPVNAPNGFYARLEAPGGIVRHTQRLDFRNGLHMRETAYERARLRIERFASMDDVNLLCQRIIVEPTDGAITLICGIDADVWDINGPHLTDFEATGGDTLRVAATTYEQRLPIAVCETCNRKADEIILVGNSVFRVFHITEKTVIDRIVTVNAEPRAIDYDQALARHKAVWARLWADSAVTIVGDHDAQSALNYSLYHLHAIAPRHAAHLSVAARGLSGQTYKGAVFWDTEIFLTPFFTLTEPALARKLLMYRVNTLGGAMAKAAEYGFDGAFFPWESQDGGLEGCTDFNVVDVFTGRPVRTFFRDRQIHISGDIAYAIGRYMDYTGDRTILSDGGDRLIKACADFYLSRAYCRPGSDVLEFTDVVGPDEYHERVDNNAFTNRVAACALQMAGYPHKVRPPRIVDGVMEQFDGYFKLEDAALADVRARVKHPREYWGTQGGVAFATQIIKQADVLSMMNLFPDDYTDAEVARNWRFYEPRTEHGSSLSACMYAMAACRFGRADLAYPLFLKSARADWDGGGKSWAGDVYIGGTHPAAAGGAYMIAAHGFAGLRLEGGKPVAKPCLPESMEAIEMPVSVGGKKYALRAGRDKADIVERG